MRLSLTRKRRVTGSACGSTVRTRALAVTDGSSASATVMTASGSSTSRDLEQGRRTRRFAPVLSGDGEDRLSRLHDLARFGGSGGDRPRDVRSELREA